MRCVERSAQRTSVMKWRNCAAVTLDLSASACGPALPVTTVEMNVEETQISVRLVTHLPQQYKVPKDVLVSSASALDRRLPVRTHVDML